MVPDLQTLDEASRLTGMSTEAIRKRFLRGQIEGISSKESNDGRVRVRLTEAQLDDLRRIASKDDDEPSEAGSRSSGDVAVHALSRLADSLERRLARAEDEVTAARALLDAERKSRDDERREWVAKLTALTTEITVLRDSGSSDRNASQAALEGIQRMGTDIQSQITGLARVLAPDVPPTQHGFLARLLRRRENKV